MIDEDPLDQLSRALAITPSPEFTARVRQQIGAQPTQTTWWSLRHLAAAAAVMCVASVGVVRWGDQAGPADKPATLVVAPAAVASVAPAPTPAPSVGAASARPRVFTPRVVPVEGVFGETLVPDDQRVALDRLLGAIRAGRTTVPAAMAEDIVDDEGRRMPRALVIEPLKLELLAGTPAEPNKDPIKDPIK